MNNKINDSGEVISGRQWDWRGNIWPSVDAAEAAITGVQRQEGMFIPVRLANGRAYPHEWVNNKLVPFNAKIGQPNGVLVDGFTLSTDKTQVTLDGTEWIIDDIPYKLQNIIEYPVPAPDAGGLLRIDRIKLDETGPTYMVGEPGISAVAPVLIYGEILLRDITVSLADTTSEPEPVVTSDNQIHYVLTVSGADFGKVGDVAKITQPGPDYGKEYKKKTVAGVTSWVLEYTPEAGGGGASGFSDLTGDPYDNANLETALNALDADIVTAQDTANLAQDGVDALETDKVDKVAGKSLLADTEITRLLGLSNVESYSFACSDETTALTAGTAKISFRMPYAFTLTSVRASLNEAPAGSTLIVNIKEGGTTIFSTNLSIDAGELTSTTAASAAVISDPALANDSLITVDIVQVGSTTAGKGLKISFIGYKP